MKLTIKSILLRDNNWWNYFQEHQENIRPAVTANIMKLFTCRLSVRGYRHYGCSDTDCTHTKNICFSCHGRGCTSCGRMATQRWIDKQREILPRTDWQHITLTMPSELWGLFESHRKLLNKIGAVAASIIKELSKSKGVIPGIFLALHTFGRDLKWNVHIHLSTTRGGISEDGSLWKSLYFKKESVMRMWRYRVITLLRKSYHNGELPLSAEAIGLLEGASFDAWLDKHYQKRWIIDCAKPKKDAMKDIQYLGGYIKRPPLSESRLKHYDGQEVVFRYLNHRTGRQQWFRSDVKEFIRRFIQHIPDKGFRLIRYYGFLSNRLRGTLLGLVRALVGDASEEKVEKLSFASLMQRTFGIDPLKCILCHSRLVLRGICYGKSDNELYKHHEALSKMKAVV